MGGWVVSEGGGNAKASPVGRGTVAEAAVSPPQRRMVLRAAALATHLCLLAALRPSDPNVCSYWER